MHWDKKITSEESFFLWMYLYRIIPRMFAQTMILSKNFFFFSAANTHLTQVQEIAPFFFAWLGGSIATAELIRAKIGWESPIDAAEKNDGVEGQTWLSKLNDRYYPGDLRFDPLGLKPNDPTEFASMQTKELQNGRLAMIASIGMIVQEQVTHHTLF